MLRTPAAQEQTVAPEGDAREWLSGSEVAASLEYVELRTSAEPLHSPEDKKQNQAARA